MRFFRSLFDRAFGIAALGCSVVLQPNHFDEEPYRLYVGDREGQEAHVLNRFEQSVAHLYLWGAGSSDAVWVLDVGYIWGNISVRLFGDQYREQKEFMRKEEALRFIEDRLGITRTNMPPKRLTPDAGKTMWETEDANATLSELTP